MEELPFLSWHLSDAPVWLEPSTVEEIWWIYRHTSGSRRQMGGSELNCKVVDVCHRLTDKICKILRSATKKVFVETAVVTVNSFPELPRNSSLGSAPSVKSKMSHVATDTQQVFQHRSVVVSSPS